MQLVSGLLDRVDGVEVGLEGLLELIPGVHLSRHFHGAVPGCRVARERGACEGDFDVILEDLSECDVLVHLEKPGENVFALISTVFSNSG